MSNEEAKKYDRTTFDWSESQHTGLVNLVYSLYVLNAKRDFLLSSNLIIIHCGANDFDRFRYVWEAFN